MNHKLTFIKSVVLLVLLSFGIDTYATTYTATQSGNWSNSATWSGGVAPVANVTTNDLIIISNGVTVTLDQEQMLDHAQLILWVYGTLSGAHSLDLNNGTLNGTGTINLHNLTLGAAGSSLFAGTMTVDNLYSYQSAQLSLQGNITVNDTLGLYGGATTILGATTLSLGSGAVINMAGGSITSNGNWNQAGNVNLLYSGSGTTYTSGEVHLSNIDKVWVSLPSMSDKLVLADNLTVSGQLMVQRGRLDLDGSNLTINGTINTMTGTGWLMGDSSSVLNINGNSNTDSIAFLPGNNVVGSLNINIAAGGWLTLASDLGAANGLHIQSGKLMIGSNNLVLGGAVSGSGYLSGTSGSRLTVNGTGNMGTLMWDSTGASIGGLTMNIGGNNASLTLGDDLTVNTLTITGGTLKLNGQHLTLGGSSAISGSGALWGDTASDITLTGTTVTGMGLIKFATGGDRIRDLELRTTNSSWISLTSDLSVYGRLRLRSGNLNLAGTSNLMLMGTDSADGGSDSSYVMTSGSGKVWMNLSDSSSMSSARTWHIGTQSYYAPVRIRNNAGANGGFGASAHAGVYANGTSGTDISNTSYGVNTSWDLETNMASNANADVEAYWSQAMETSQFGRGSVYLSHYTNGAWDTYANSAAVSHSGGMWSTTRTGITSFSPFAVLSSGTTGVQDLAADAAFTAYPNPAANTLTVTVPEAAATSAITLHDVLGHQVATYPVSQTANKIDVSHLTPGVYYVSLNDKHTQKFVKQ